MRVRLCRRCRRRCGGFEPVGESDAARCRGLRSQKLKRLSLGDPSEQGGSASYRDWVDDQAKFVEQAGVGHVVWLSVVESTRWGVSASTGGSSSRPSAQESTQSDSPSGPRM